ncbi:MAG: hypothetical protein JNJ49_17240, partial [Bdellovibrionaceae bacterium]|nr:hypothetical protein [Pseudobdellovibrionaceae bacterium]
MKTVSGALKTILIMVGLGLFSGQAEARRFDMKNERFATYFGASSGVTLMSDYAYGQAGGTGVSTD